MKSVLLLVDLQRDYLVGFGLEPTAGFVVERAARLLNACRRHGVPVVHIWTTVDRESDERMPHWKRLGRWQCVRGTEGHQPPVELNPAASEIEIVVHKRFFSGFGGSELDHVLRQFGADTLFLAGVHLHACVRATALDAYERGYDVWIADDAVASNDPLHAAITRRYLAARVARFLTVAELVERIAAPPASSEASPTVEGRLPVAVVDGHEEFRKGRRVLSRHSPSRIGTILDPIPVGDANDVASSVDAARRACREESSRSVEIRAAVLTRFAERIAADPGWPEEIVRETGKPIRYARDEIAGAVAQLHALARRAVEDARTTLKHGPHSRRCPVGVIALITPWNNPLFLPLGKLGAAIIYGNTVVWKPAPAGSTIALRVLQQLHNSGLPPGVVNVVLGDRSTAEFLMEHPAVAAVTLTGSLSAGYSAQEICARRHIPLQAELGGNNAAVVWSDANLTHAAELIAEGAFAMAGQRCTANRRVVVERHFLDEFLSRLSAAAATLRLGDPLDPGTHIGPMISTAERDRVAAVIRRARSRNIRLIQPLSLDDGPVPNEWMLAGAYHPPVIAVCDDPADELVQEETFGPVLVVQSVDTWDEAMARCNGVRQGLVAALFSNSADRQRRFLSEAEAGILKINRATAGADVDLPFGGWKASGIGPPEHGESDREFYTRNQTIYP